MNCFRVMILSVSFVFTIFTFLFVSSGKQDHQYINGKLEYIKENIPMVMVCY